MPTRSHIEWTEMTWNPVTGCTKVSQGCKHCYAERMARRLEAMGSDRYRNGFEVTLHPDLLDVPSGRRQPRVVFVNSMSDLFHDDIPLAYIRRVFATMRDRPWGGVRKDLTGRELYGRTYSEMPRALQPA
ncbi:MAG: DUF5131 family protein [Burkholderiales bacterium]